MIRTYYINEDNDLLGVLSVRAINRFKVRNRKELEEKKEEILSNIKKHGCIYYGKKTSREFLNFFGIELEEVE